MQRSFGYRSRPRKRYRKNRFPKGKGLSVILTILLVLFAGWVFVKGVQFIFSGEASSSQSAELTIVKGRVKALLADSQDWAPTLTEQKFFEGESVRTENNTKASLVILSANTIFLDENTELELEKIEVKSSGRKQVVLNLKKGRIWTKVSNDDFSEDADSNFQVNSPYMVVNVKGTAFNLESSAVQDSIQLLKGSVAIEVKNPEKAGDSIKVDLGVGQKLVGNSDTYGKLSRNEDVIEIIDNGFMESQWNLDNFEQFFPQDAAVIKRRIELNAVKEKVESTAIPSNNESTLEAPIILTPAHGDRFPASTESVELEGSVSENTFQVSVNGYTLSKYVPGAKKWQYFASTKFGTIVPGENKYTVVATDRDGNISPPAEITIFYEGAGQVPVGNPIEPITTENVNDFRSPVITSPAIFQASPNEIYQTSASVVTFSGTVDPKTNAVEVNGFRLTKFKPGHTEFAYIANANYGNMKEGENIYTITALGPDGKKAETTISIFYSPLSIGGQ
ncbi:MAG TPA: FecR family protein [Candidatus Gracilibacteria bacterium]